MESQIQKKLINILEKQGWYVLKLMKTNKNGISDLLAQKKGNRDIFIEVKDVTGHIEPLQLYRLEEIILLTDSIPVIFWPEYRDNVIIFGDNKYQVIRTFDEFVFFINNIVNKC